MFGEQVVARDMQQGAANKKHVPLDDVERFAGAVESRTHEIEMFCARFFGEPTGANCENENSLSGYNGSLARLGNAIDRLAKATDRLSEIG